jgi:hypothetical protein
MVLSHALEAHICMTDIQMVTVCCIYMHAYIGGGWYLFDSLIVTSENVHCHLNDSLCSMVCQVPTLIDDGCLCWFLLGRHSALLECILPNLPSCTRLDNVYYTHKVLTCTWRTARDANGTSASIQAVLCSIVWILFICNSRASRWDAINATSYDLREISRAGERKKGVAWSQRH